MICKMHFALYHSYEDIKKLSGENFKRAVYEFTMTNDYKRDNDTSHTL